ncbi:DUF4181 domain-containing protein [Rossellomorea sp. NPDC071047]|uniref:DUF4181 domain-containing protein n=1 Tax=Rossellomorea sp. NPDC071047 TaxID=3390675 RepID=UPI003D00A6F9
MVFNAMIEKKLRKSFHIYKEDMNELRHPLHQWGERILLVLMVAGVIIILYKYENIISPEWYFLCFFIVHHVFRAFMEWLFYRKTKEYVLTISTIASAITMVIFMAILEQLSI